jgi:small subunit ribosomal protein S16
MLAIRFQRTGRRGHAQFRVIVQDARLSPTSGKVVAYLGNYNPHTKAAVLDKEKAQSFISNGAQPSPRASQLLKAEGVKLPKWVAAVPKKKSTTRHPEKLRRNRPADAKPAAAPAEEPADVPAASEVAAEVAPEPPVEEVAANEPATEAVAVPAEPEVSAEAEAVSPETAEAVEDTNPEETDGAA